AQHVLAQRQAQSIVDLGSGAGFPGVPFALMAPETSMTLIESNQKKATFLKEVIFALKLKNARVFADQAENYKELADLVTMRAVERFESTLPMAVNLAKASGRVALMIGSAQVEAAIDGAKGFQWDGPVAVPSGHSRVLLVGTRMVKVEQS